MISRREFLIGTGAVALAGCTSPQSTRPETDLTVQIRNRTDATETVAITVTDSEDSTVVDVEESVPASVSNSVQRSGLAGDAYTIGVEGDRWATGGVWDPDTCRNYTFITTLDETDGVPRVAADAQCADGE